jgi:hypothetical protein
MKNFLKWGLIIVGIVTGLIGFATAGEFDPATGSRGMIGQIMGWISMLVAAVCLFLGIKERRDSDPSDFTFGRGWTEGFLISALSSVFSGIWTYIYFSFIDTEFISQMKEFTLSQMASGGMKPEEVEQAQSMMDMSFSAGAWAIWVVVSFLLVGMLLSLIFAAIVNSGNKNAGTPATA